MNWTEFPTLEKIAEYKQNSPYNANMETIALHIKNEIHEAIYQKCQTAVLKIAITLFREDISQNFYNNIYEDDIIQYWGFICEEVQKILPNYCRVTCGYDFIDVEIIGV
jgi:hypothetical protein